MLKLSAKVSAFLLFLASGMVLAQTDTPTPENSMLPNNTYTYEAPNFSFEYILDYYSLRFGCTDAVGEVSITFPGIIDIVPNDAVIYGAGPDGLPFITIAITEVTDDLELEPSILGEGSLILYVDEVFQEENVQEIDLNGVAALRIDNLPVGQAGISSHVVALYNGLRLDIIAEPAAGASELGDAIFNTFLESFKFSGD